MAVENYISENKRIEFVYKKIRLFFENIAFESSAMVSDIAVMTENVDTAVNGAYPFKIRLKGHFFKDDIIDIANQFQKLSGSIIANAVIDGVLYNKLVLLKAVSESDSLSPLGTVEIEFMEVAD